MTEIPEHLLQRSRERRAALGLGGGDDAGAAPAPAAVAGSGTEVTPAASAAPTPAAPVEPEPKAPEPVPHYVEAANRRQRIPVWAVPVLAGLIFWAPIYIGTLQEPVDDSGPLSAGGDIYDLSCSGCHGPAGGGASGPQLSDGEVLLTFPDWQRHADYVLVGSEVNRGQVVGDPDRPGGPRIAGEIPGQMPAFADTLSTLQVLEVVLYERVTHGGADIESDDIVSLLEAIEAIEGGEDLDVASLSPGAATEGAGPGDAPSDADSQ